MKILETVKFNRLRKKIREAHEREALFDAVLAIVDDPTIGKHLKGELRDLRFFRYSVRGQSRRIIYKLDEDTLILFSFGPRGDIYK